MARRDIARGQRRLHHRLIVRRIAVKIIDQLQNFASLPVGAVFHNAVRRWSSIWSFGIGTIKGVAHKLGVKRRMGVIYFFRDWNAPITRPSALLSCDFAARMS
jgi:hypothetical protein